MCGPTASSLSTLCHGYRLYVVAARCAPRLSRHTYLGDRGPASRRPTRLSDEFSLPTNSRFRRSGSDNSRDKARPAGGHSSDAPRKAPVHRNEAHGSIETRRIGPSKPDALAYRQEALRSNDRRRTGLSHERLQSIDARRIGPSKPDARVNRRERLRSIARKAPVHRTRGSGTSHLWHLLWIILPQTLWERPRKGLVQQENPAKPPSSARKKRSRDASRPAARWVAPIERPLSGKSGTGFQTVGTSLWKLITTCKSA